MSAPSTQEARGMARELGGRIAAAGALVVALVSLIQHAPLWLASLRGAATLLILAAGNRVGVAALGRAMDSDLERVQSKKEKES